MKCGYSSVVERLLPKQDVSGSSPDTRSINKRRSKRAALVLHGVSVGGADGEGVIVGVGVGVNVGSAGRT